MGEREDIGVGERDRDGIDGERYGTETERQECVRDRNRIQMWDGQRDMSGRERERERERGECEKE